MLQTMRSNLYPFDLKGLPKQLIQTDDDAVEEGQREPKALDLSVCRL